MHHSIRFGFFIQVLERKFLDIMNRGGKNLPGAISGVKYLNAGVRDITVVRGYQEWSVSRQLLERVLEDDEIFDERFVRRAVATLDAGR